MEFAPKQPVPVFPLPRVVLFPRALLPLHIFELRYRTMVRDALSGERLIVMAALRPGWERDYHGSPEFHPLGCLARVEDVEWLPNDCYNLKVLGLARVRIESLAREYPYRSVRVTLLQQAPYSEDDPLVELERRALHQAFERLARRAVPGEQNPVTLPGDLPFETLVNSICMMLDTEVEEKLDLLGMDSVVERSRRVRELVEERLRVPAPGPEPGGEKN